MTTRHGQARPPRRAKAEAWAVAALEQSRGAHLMRIGATLGLEDLPRPLIVAHPGGAATRRPLEAATVAVGPEGGFAEDEIPPDTTRIGLGERILRVETAAIVAAALAIVAV